MVLANKEVDLPIGVEFDLFGISVVSLTDRDLGSDSPIVVLVTNGLKGKLKVLVSLL
jgi:hypothetical protein